LTPKSNAEKPNASSITSIRHTILTPKSIIQKEHLNVSTSFYALCMRSQTAGIKPSDSSPRKKYERVLRNPKKMGSSGAVIHHPSNEKTNASYFSKKKKESFLMDADILEE